MYEEVSFLTLDLVKRIADEYDWPEAYHLEDEAPDGVCMVFPKSNFMFMDGMNGDVEVGFLPQDTNFDRPLTLLQAMLVFLPLSERTGPLYRFKNATPFQTLENTEIGVRNACDLMSTHLREVILGDFSWVAKYPEAEASLRK